MTENKKKMNISVIGAGKAGVRIVESLFAMPGTSDLKMAIADTDASTLKDSKVPNIIKVGFEWTYGLGCGGDTRKGETSFANPETRRCLEEFFKDSSMIIVVGGLGGGTATGGAPVLARTAKKMKIPCVFLMTLPFSFEGAGKRAISDEGVRQITSDTDVLIKIPNDILYLSMPHDTSFEKAFEKANSEMAMAAMGLAGVLSSTNIISTSYSDFETVLRERNSSAIIGTGGADSSDGENKCLKALDRLIKSPLLGGAEQLASADALIVGMTGGKDINIGEVRQALDAVVKMAGSNTRIVVGAGMDPEYGSKVRITIVAFKYENLPEVEAPLHVFSSPRKDPVRKTRNQKRARHSDYEELNLPGLDSPLDVKGIFTNSTKNVLFGEDLDVPTFYRQGIYIDKGK